MASKILVPYNIKYFFLAHIHIDSAWVFTLYPLFKIQAEGGAPVLVLRQRERSDGRTVQGPFDLA